MSWRWRRWLDSGRDECVAAWDGCCPWAGPMVVRLSLPDGCEMRGLGPGHHWQLFRPAAGQLGLLEHRAERRTGEPSGRTEAWGPSGVCAHGAPPSTPVFGPLRPNRWFVDRGVAVEERPGLVEMVEALGP